MEQIWNKLYDLLRLQGQLETVLQEYKTQQTDEERVCITLRLLQIYQIVPPSCKGIAKDSKKSTEFREQGNKIYASTPLNGTLCVEAFKLYCKSIAYAPPFSKELALAYANRSAVLLKMKMYNECLLDIERTFSLDYPDALRSKLYLRKIECLTALRIPNIQEAIEEIESWMDKMSMSDSNRTKFNEKLNVIKETMSHKSDVPRETKSQNALKQPLPTVISKSSEVPCASDAIAIAYNEQFGRHIVATRDIEPGEVLVVERPYTMVLGLDNLQTHCFYCLEVCWTSIPCDHCTCAMYCSEHCKNADWRSSHDIECAIYPHLIELQFTKLDLMSLRLTIHAIRKSGGIKKLKAEIKDVENQKDLRTKGFTKDAIFDSNEYRSVYSLVTNTEKRDVHDLFRRSLDTCAILYFLLMYSNMFGDKKHFETQLDTEDVNFVGGLIMRHQQTIPSNGHSVAEECGMKHVEHGIAFLPFLSLINHSCDSNSFRLSTSGHTISYALYPIEKGEQVFDNYGQHYALTPKSLRRKNLMKQYYFYCTCVPCREDWPLLSDVKSYNCIVQSQRTKKMLDQSLSNFNDYFTLASEASSKLKEPCIINDLLDMIRVLFQHVKRPCEELISVVETLKRIYALRGNQFEIPVI